MKKIFILFVTLFLFNGLTKAEVADTMYVMKSGSVVGIHAVANVDSVIFYKPTLMDIDGNNYTTVKIGTQTWMVENLKVTKLNDGTPIANSGASSGFFTQAEWSALITPARCWEGHESGAEPVGGNMLYNFYAVSSGKLAPAGWHIPTAADWDILAATVPGVLALKLLAVGVGAGTNELGFNAPWAGGRFSWSLDYRPGGESAYWTSTNFSDNDALSIWIRQAGITPGSSTAKNSGMPVRLIKD
jgi:uncharacterized protein (TIGR02145 family)